MARTGLQPARRPSVSVIVALLLALHVHAVVTWTKNSPDKDPENKSGAGPHIYADTLKASKETKDSGTGAIPTGEGALPKQDDLKEKFKWNNWWKGQAGGMDNSVLKDDKKTVETQEKSEGALESITKANDKSQTELQESMTKEEEAKRELASRKTHAEMLRKDADVARRKADAARKVADDAKAEAGKAEKKEGTLDETVKGDTEAVDDAEDKVDEIVKTINGNETAEDYTNGAEAMDALDKKEEAEHKEDDHKDAAERAQVAADNLHDQAKLDEDEAVRLEKLATDAEEKAKEAEDQVKDAQTIVDAKEQRTDEKQEEVDILTLLQQDPKRLSGAEELLKYKDEKTGGLLMFTYMEGTKLTHEEWKDRVAAWAAVNKEWWPSSPKARCCKWGDSDAEVRSEYNVCPVDGHEGKELTASYRCTEAAPPHQGGKKEDSTIIEKIGETVEKVADTAENAVDGNLLSEDPDEKAEREEEASEEKTPNGKKVSSLALRDMHGQRVVVNAANCKELNKDRGITVKGIEEQKEQAVDIANNPLSAVAKTVDLLCKHFPAVSKTMELLGCCKEPPKSAANDTATGGEAGTQETTEGADDTKTETSAATRRVRMAIRAAGRVALHRFKRRVRRFLRGMMH